MPPTLRTPVKYQGSREVQQIITQYWSLGNLEKHSKTPPHRAEQGEEDCVYRGDFIQLEARMVKALWAKPTPFSEIDSEVFLLDQWNERNPEERGGVYMFRESFHDALFQIARQP